MTRITSDTYVNLATVAAIKLNGFKPGTAPIIANNRTLVISFTGGHTLEFKAATADEVVESLRINGIDLHPNYAPRCDTHFALCLIQEVRDKGFYLLRMESERAMALPFVGDLQADVAAIVGKRSTTIRVMATPVSRLSDFLWGGYVLKGFIDARSR